MKKKHVPLIERAPKAWQRVALAGVALVLMFTWFAVVDKAWSAEPVSIPGSPATQVVSPKMVPVPEGGYRQKHHLYKNTKRVKASVHLRIHTVSYHVKDKNGNLVPRTMKGHLICPKGWYASFSKYKGMFCQSFKENKHMTKAVIKCGGAVAIGYAFGGTLKGIAGGVATCVWSGLLK